MKGLEKLTSIRLAEVLSQKNVVPTDAITDALYTQDHFGEPFVEVLVSMGHITEWDLARVVVDHFQLPFITASNCDISGEVLERLPQDALFENLLVPLDTFGDGMTVAMPILTPFEVIDGLQRTHDCDLFPYVGLISENKRVLQEMFKGYVDWQKRRDEQLEQRRQTKPKKSSKDWMNIFDTGDEAVRNQLDR
ncbi:MAG: hypothetical protein AAF628_28495 [Planctomycetota bacterium]